MEFNIRPFINKCAVILMNRDELWDYLNKRGSSKNNDIKYRYRASEQLFSCLQRKNVDNNYFFTMLVFHVWNKIFKQKVNSRIGIKLLKFLCGIDNEEIYCMIGTTTALDNTTVYTKGMLNIKTKPDTNLENEKYMIDCINCNFKTPNDKLSFMCINCNNCYDCYDCVNCNNCNDCSRCNNCDDCYKCEYCNECNNCNKCERCDQCSHCDDCENCSDSINIQYLQRCKYCSDCEYCSDCKNSKKCVGCARSNDIQSCSDCDKCNNCTNCRKCRKCENCSNCAGCEKCNECDNCVSNINSTRCKNSKNCVKCEDCTDNVDCNFNIKCIACTKCKKCESCTNCEKCRRCVNCTDCSDCSGCNDCSDCTKCVNQKSKEKDTEKFFKRSNMNIPKEGYTFNNPFIIDLTTNGDRLELSNKYIQYFDAEGYLVFQGTCQYKYPQLYYDKCMMFAIEQGWFYYADLCNIPRCSVDLSTKSKYKITIQDIVDFCKDHDNDAFIEWLQTRTMKMKNSYVYIYDRAGNLIRNENTISMIK